VADPKPPFHALARSGITAASDDGGDDIPRQAEAAAHRLMADALSQNASLVEYKKALRWDGKLPQAIYAAAPIPCLQIPAATRGAP
jgi:hypothetical protein